MFETFTATARACWQLVGIRRQRAQIDRQIADTRRELADLEARRAALLRIAPELAGATPDDLERMAADPDQPTVLDALLRHDDQPPT